MNVLCRGLRRHIRRFLIKHFLFAVKNLGLDLDGSGLSNSLDAVPDPDSALHADPDSVNPDA